MHTTPPRPKHSLKSIPVFFQACWVGDKGFEIRKNDRDFQERDEVVLCEWDGAEFTGREIHGFIRYLTRFEQKEGFVVFAFEETHRVDN
jgi:hypothetical protein